MTLILDANDLVGVLDYPTAIEAVDGAFRDLGSGNALMPVRHTIRVEAHEGVSAFMPAYLPGKDQLGIKVVSAFGRNREKFGLPTVIGSILLLDAKSGMPMAIVDGTYVTAVRTAAASAVATKYMAREDTSTVQGETHLLAISEVRRLDGAVVNSRDSKRCEDFCKRMSKKTGIKVRPGRPQEVAKRDIVATSTSSFTLQGFSDARSFWTPLYSLFRPVALRMDSYVFSPLVKNSDNRALRGHRQSCSRGVLFGLIH